jgi:hypothetical protein
VSAADEAWAAECCLFDVDVRLITADADDDDKVASLRRAIGLGAQFIRGRKQLVVIQLGLGSCSRWSASQAHIAAVQ